MKEILIHINIYKEPLSQIRHLILRLKRFGYHRIVCCFDGLDHPQIKNFLKQEKVHVIQNENRLKEYGNGGLHAQAYLTRFVMSPKKCDYLIKIDPDTEINKPLNYFPNYVGCNYTQLEKNIYGGCVVWSMDAAKRVAMSGLLYNRKYQKDFYNYYNKRLREKVVCEDRILYDVLSILEIPIDPMTDTIYARCNNGTEDFETDGRYCFQHF